MCLLAVFDLCVCVCACVCMCVRVCVFRTSLYIFFILVLGATCVRSFLLDDYMIAEKVSVWSWTLHQGICSCPCSIFVSCPPPTPPPPSPPAHSPPGLLPTQPACPPTPTPPCYPLTPLPTHPSPVSHRCASVAVRALAVLAGVTSYRTNVVLTCVLQVSV